jgi:hypothetical protein
VFALEERDDFFLGRYLLSVCGVERLFGGIDCGMAGFDEVF